MSQQNTPISAIKANYLKFVKERLAKTDYHAKEKLERIDQLAKIVRTARENYHKKNKLWAFF